MAIDPAQEFLVQPVDASWLQCNIECQEACPVGTNCRGYLNLAAEGRFEEGYILSREPNPVAAMCSAQRARSASLYGRAAAAISTVRSRFAR